MNRFDRIALSIFAVCAAIVFGIFATLSVMAIAAAPVASAITAICLLIAFAIAWSLIGRFAG